MCTHCRRTLAWYDLIPIFSWIALRGKCRYCQQPISWLYPFIELLTACIITLLWYHYPLHEFPAVFFIASCLIITLRSDFETLRISRFVTIFAVPFVLFSAYIHALPISFYYSIFGSITGYIGLWSIKTLGDYMTGKQTMGLGDVELLCFIGAALGPLGAFICLQVASIIGSLIGVIILYIKGYQTARTLKLPLGTYLSAVALVQLILELY